jgi:hypothetical protein
MHPLVRRDLPRLGQLDHVHRRRIAALSARPAFQRGLELPNRRIPRPAYRKRKARAPFPRHVPGRSLSGDVKKTGHRIKYVKVDADTGEEVSSDEITKGYKVDTEVSKDELENIALESTRTIDINEFVPKADIDPRYLIRPYYLVPDGKVGTTPLPSSGKPSATWKWLLLVAWFLPAASTSSAWSPWAKASWGR